MRTRFLHIADIHLGYEQYGSSARYNDFYQTFERAVDDALHERVDFVILAGDLFHQRTISPQTLLQAAHQLDRLRRASIPAIGVIGNHERPHYRNTSSWLDYLAGRELLTLLAPRYEDDILRFDPADRGLGGYVDVAGVRIYGVPYYGSTAPRVVQDAAICLEDSCKRYRPPFTILMTHAGLEGSLPNFSANLTMEQIAALRPYVDYMALGHVHKPFLKDGWIYNPGSLEPVSMAEASYEGGGLLVEVACDAGHPPAIQTEPRRYATRPFIRRTLSVSAFEDPEALYDGVTADLKAHPKPPGKRPVVEYQLDGVLRFDRHALDMPRLEEMVKTHFNSIVTLVRNRTVPAEFQVATDSDQMSREELERQVLRDLLMRDARYGRQADRWADLIREVKQLALERNSGETIVEHLRAGMTANADMGCDDADHTA